MGPESEREKKNENWENRSNLRRLPRNVWATSMTSFFMDISSEMIINILPLFLSNVLGVRTNIIGLIEGIAEASASLLKVFSGWISDKLRQRKWLAVIGYGLSAVAKPFFYLAQSWGVVLAVRWVDRVGKGLRTSPRDALVADSIDEKSRGLAFGFHRAADTAGAMIGLVIAFLVVWQTQSAAAGLSRNTFQTIVLFSILPGFLAVLSLVVGARDVPVEEAEARPTLRFKGLGKPFLIFLVIVGIFDLGNSSDAFLVLRAQERGLNILGILGMLATFNLVYALVSTPGGSLSDRIGRRKVLIGGWLAYSLIYFGFGFASRGWQIWALYAIYGVYYGLAFGTGKALVADLVPQDMRGIAYGTYAAVLGLLNFPASFFAGVLWQGIGPFEGFGPAGPFIFGGVLALIAAVWMFFWRPTELRGA